MATEEQRARRRAQRASAERLKATRDNKYQPVLPRAIRAPTRAAREKYANDVIAGREPYPDKGTREANNLASLASKASWGKADPRFEKAFKQYWYHKNDEKTDDADRESSSDSADNEEN